MGVGRVLVDRKIPEDSAWEGAEEQRGGLPCCVILGSLERKVLRWLEGRVTPSFAHLSPVPSVGRSPPSPQSWSTCPQLQLPPSEAGCSERKAGSPGTPSPNNKITACLPAEPQMVNGTLPLGEGRCPKDRACEVRSHRPQADPTLQIHSREIRAINFVSANHSHPKCVAFSSFKKSFSHWYELHGRLGGSFC